MSMKTFTSVKGSIPFLFALVFAINANAQTPTVTLSPSSAQNINTGGTISFTATRNSNSGNWTGGNSQFTFTFSSSPAGVAFTNNPAVIPSNSGTSSTSTASFPTAGTYQVICTVSEGGGGLTASSTATTVTVTAPVPANLWATSSNGTPGFRFRCFQRFFYQRTH